MKYVPMIIAFFLFGFSGYSQDTIKLKNGSVLPSKVLEITTTEIKYKRFDNLEGPVYTMLKNEVKSIKYKNGTIEIMSEATTANDSIGNPSTIYFLRKSGYSGSMVGYEIFIDENSICKLNNSKFITRELPPGTHNFSVQFYGKTSKTKAEKLEINCEAGQTYYIQVTQNSKVYASDTYCKLLDQTEAKTLLLKLNKDDDCN